MAVYGDNAMLPYRRMKMCYMIDDSREEIEAMADRIGVARRWIQNPGTYREHYDICGSKRALAVKHGAVEIDWMELGRKLQERRESRKGVAV